MFTKCETAEDRRRLEAEVAYFYTHGGPVMDGGIPRAAEYAMRSTGKNVSRCAIAKSRPLTASAPAPEKPNRRIVVPGGLEAEVAYFYTHGGPIMD